MREGEESRAPARTLRVTARYRAVPPQPQPARAPAVHRDSDGGKIPGRGIVTRGRQRAAVAQPETGAGSVQLEIRLSGSVTSPRQCSRKAAGFSSNAFK
jgi:hypothetical protein